jgi:hypothetical protein
MQTLAVVSPKSRAFRRRSRHTPTRLELAVRRAVIAVSLALYAVSLVLPATLGIRMMSAGGMDRGYGLLIGGWLGVMQGQFAWLANPVYFLALWFVYRGRWRAIALSAFAAVLALDTLDLYRTGTFSDSGPVPFGGVLAGYWVWLASILVVLAGAILLALLELRAPAEQPALSAEPVEQPAG